MYGRKKMMGGSKMPRMKAAMGKYVSVNEFERMCARKHNIPEHVKNYSDDPKIKPKQ